MKANWNKITTRDFIDIREAVLTEENPNKKRAKIIAIVTGYSLEDILKKMSIKQLKETWAEIGWASGFPPEIPIKERFKFKGRRFRAVLNAYDINAGQFIDGTQLSEGDELTQVRKFNVLLGVLLKEEISWWKFWKKPLSDEEKFELVLDMPITYVYPNVVFFCRVFKDLSPTILSYLEEQIQELTQTVHGSLSGGDGESQ